MAKLKIRGLVRDLKTLEEKFNTLLAFAVYMTHKNGGTLNVTSEEIRAVPESKFKVHQDEKGFNLELDYT
jgi:hypothetical protein